MIKPDEIDENKNSFETDVLPNKKGNNIIVYNEMNNSNENQVVNHENNSSHLNVDNISINDNEEHNTAVNGTEGRERQDNQIKTSINLQNEQINNDSNVLPVNVADECLIKKKKLVELNPTSIEKELKQRINFLETELKEKNKQIA